MYRCTLLTMLAANVFLLASCSTRQVVDSLEGSTEQRLVTHSINRVISKLPEDPLLKVDGKKLYMDTHFITEHPLVDYATARMRAEIDMRHNVVWVDSKDKAEMYLNVFFTSLGTDKDSFGLSIPLPVQGDGTEVATLDIFSLKMFHGISEMYFYLSDLEGNTVDFVGNEKAQIRSDTVSTPFISFPLNTMD